MPWTYQDYPASMKNLMAEVRRKAIDIANALLDEGYEEGRAIAIATAQAEKWAQRRDKQIVKKNSTGMTGQAVAEKSEDNHPIHVLPNPKEEGWIAKQDQKRIAQGKDKNDVIRKAQEKAKAQHTELQIHNEDGKVVHEEDYS
jgi:uncharacterized protein YdaT